MMLISRNGELSGRDNRSGNTWARACDACGSSPCRVYCRADEAYLCGGCDARQHAPNSPHERVWVCEGCERSPAAFLCKADAASLCAACDADVHSANPLASRHHRVHILPLYSPSAADPAGTKRTTTASMGEADNELDEEDEDEAASWLLLNPFDKCSKINNDSNTAATNGYFLGADVDKYLDLVEYTSAAGDAVQLSTVDRDEPHFDILVPNGIPNLGFHLDFDIKSEFGYSTSSTITHTVSSLDAGIVPESTMSEISTANNPPPPKGTIDLFSCSPPLQQMPTQLSPMDREARVMRYREKKKTRKFEKTIRYASRKAYAETRPRIKGRFAKRNDADQNGGYGIVPSF